MKNMEKFGIIFSALLIIITILSLQAVFLNSQSAPLVNETTVTSPQISPLPIVQTVLPTTKKNIAIPLSPTNSVIPTHEVVSPVVPLKTIKDSELWFTIQVPETWVVTMERISNPEGYEGLVYMTSLYNTEEFFIITYAISRDQDQAFRTYYRNTWTPYPNESTVIINGKPLTGLNQNRLSR